MKRFDTTRRIAMTAAFVLCLGGIGATARAQVGDTDSGANEEQPAVDADDNMEQRESPRKARRRTLEALLNEVRHPERTTVFHSPPSSHFDVLSAVMRDLSAAAQTCDEAAVVFARKRLAPIAMELVRLRQRGTTFLVVREMKNALRGNGVYIVRCGDAVPLALEAPHSYFDLSTATVTYKAFRKTKARFLLINSVQRYTGRKLEVATDDAHPADMAHNPRGMFQAAHQGILAALGQTLFVQFHGFDASWRDVDVVFSDGRVEPQTLSEQLARLWVDPSLRMVVFGRQFKGLGAMTNAQAQATHAAGGRFLHLELSLELRRELGGGGKRLRALCEGLVEVAQKEP
ncbi:MAG: hypothetical protein MUC50_04875 [Myxococcota bacterium]|jgi:hypothetical protein|nr:hypothetical protein [Myxococcota bacterium]